MKKLILFVVVALAGAWFFRLGATPTHMGTGIGYNAELASQIIRPRAVKPVSDGCAFMMVWWRMRDSTRVASIGCGTVRHDSTSTEDTLFVASDFVNGVSAAVLKIPRSAVDSLGELRPFGQIHKKGG